MASYQFTCSFIQYLLALVSWLANSVNLLNLASEGSPVAKVNSVVTMETVNRVAIGRRRGLPCLSLLLRFIV